MSPLCICIDLPVGFSFVKIGEAHGHSTKNLTVNTWKSYYDIIGFQKLLIEVGRERCGKTDQQILHCNYIEQKSSGVLLYGRMIMEDIDV